MSALGSVKWYPEYCRKYPPENAAQGPLVLGKYPLEFINEVSARLGSEFYAWHIRHTRLSGDRVQSTLRPDMQPIGSLLPFSPGQYGDGYQAYSHINLQSAPVDHPSVKSWRVQEDGTVQIREVGIMAMTNPPEELSSEYRRLNFARKDERKWDNVFLRAPLLFSEDTAVHAKTQEDLADAVGTSINTFMVCLGDGRMESYGVLLQQISRGDVQKMVKIGTWYSFNPHKSEHSRVNIQGGYPGYVVREENDIVASTVVNWIVI
jgi:hypothetical protein